MARRTKDEAERTRDAILDAAERVFHKHGVAHTSLEQIARNAKVTRGAVYWHFKDKIELCEAMMQRVFLPQEDILDQLASKPSSTPLEDLKYACIHSLKLMATDKRRQRVVSILMFRCEYVEEMAFIMERRRECKDHMFTRALKIFEHAKKLGQLPPHWPPHTASVGLQALMGGLIISFLEGRKDFDLIKSGVSCLEAFFASLAIKPTIPTRKSRTATES
jgi:AcrR family transcriptional regulator